MPLGPEDHGFLKRLHKALVDQALQPESPFYEPVYQMLNLDDPVSLMQTHIDFSDIESIQLFSGFRGSGKTTELFRLKCRLEEQGYFVVYADALNYVNPAEPIEITDLMIVLAGAFSDALETELGVDIARETFWARIANFLTATELRLKEAGIKTELATPGKEVLGGLKTGVDLKLELKTASTFRRNLQHLLACRLAELKSQVDSFFEDGIKLIRAKRGQDTKVVFLFDQLEQMRGLLQTEKDVIRSIERIFSIHIEMLKIPYVHAVYTVPPWLKFVLQGAPVRIILLPTAHLWRNDASRSADPPAWHVFRSAVKRRLGEEGLRRLFGDHAAEEHPLVDRVIGVCGGHFRDLLRLLRETVVRAASLSELPAPPELVASAINAARRDFLPIAQDDATWLAEIARVRSTALRTTEPSVVNRLTRFLDSHQVLYFVNADEWYDIHPLIREEVEQVVQASAISQAG
jgi:hypothetical protein